MQSPLRHLVVGFMSVDKIIKQKAVEVRFSVLELSAWGFNPRRTPRLLFPCMSSLLLIGSLLYNTRALHQTD